MTNPYEAPTDTSTTRPLLGRRSMVGIEFESDWSPQGLRQRRRHWWHRILDACFVAFIFLWIGSLMMSAGSPYRGIFCILTPMLAIFSIIWISNLSFRSGESFRKKYPGISGRVRGRVDGRTVVIHGPTVSVATRIRNCLLCNVSTSSAVLQPPGFETALPIVGTDITRHWPATPTAEKVSERDLLNELFPDPEVIRVTDTLRGSDLRSFPCWRRWRLSGWVLFGFGILTMAWALFRTLSLPSHILDPPSHYTLSDTDIHRVTRLAITTVVGFGFLIAGIWQWSRTWRKIGRFSVSIHPQHVSIANQALAWSYHGEALQHFRWTAVGLVATDARGRVLFVIPARWLDNDATHSLQAWFDRDTEPPSQSHYVGPKI